MRIRVASDATLHRKRVIYRLAVVYAWLPVSRRQMLDWTGHQLFIVRECEFVTENGKPFEVDDEFLDRAVHGPRKRKNPAKDGVANAENRWLTHLRHRAIHGVKQGPHRDLLDRYRLLLMAITAWNPELGAWIVEKE